jgi:peptidyl-prolyl cis-trans isomerase B (cyclophilin B)
MMISLTSTAGLGLFFILSATIYQSQATNAIVSNNFTVTKKVYFNITIDDLAIGQIVFGLFGKTVPKTVDNFVAFAVGTPGYGYQGSIFHRIIKNFVVQGGDFVNRDGTGFISIYGTVFNDENFIIKNRRRFVNMANKGKDTNGSQFAILLVDAPWLDDKHVVFAYILEGMDVVHKLENLPTNGVEHPIPTPIVSKCGVIDVPVPFDITPD